MKKIAITIFAILVSGISSTLLGQDSPLSIELFGGAGFLASSGGTFDEFRGGYAYPAEASGQLRTFYSAEYQGSYFLKINLGWCISRRFSVQLANQLALPRYAFDNTYYMVSTGKSVSSGPPGGYPALKMANSSYYYTPALGIRVNLLRRTDSPYFELLYGRTFRHLDLKRNSDYYSASDFFEFSRLRDRSSRAYMQISMGMIHRLGDRYLLHLRVGLDTIHEASSGPFFLEESGQYMTFDGSIGLGYSF